MAQHRFRDSRNKWIYPDMVPSEQLELNDPMVRQGIRELNTQDGDSHWESQVQRHKNALKTFEKSEREHYEIAKKAGLVNAATDEMPSAWQEFIAEDKSRMATEAIQEEPVVKELIKKAAQEPEYMDDLVAQAQEYLSYAKEASTPRKDMTKAMSYELMNQKRHMNAQLQRFADIDEVYRQAGVPVSIGPDLEQSYLDSRALRGDVPAPYVSKDNGIESRVHTTYEVNPYTNEREIVPFKDTRTDKALVTQFGRGVDIGQHEQAGEYTQEKALKLMGYDVGLNPNQADHGGRADFLVNDGSQGGYKIDGMVEEANNMKTMDIPVYTYINPTAIDSERNYGGAANHVEKIIRQKMKDFNMTVEEATDQLLRDKHLTGSMDWNTGEYSEQRSAGKLRRNNPDILDSPHDVYDELLVTGYPRQEKNYNVKFNKINDRRVGPANILTAAPTTIHSVDLGLARKLSEEALRGSSHANRVTTKPNRGYRGNGPARSIVSQEFNKSDGVGGVHVIRDVTETNPLVGQLLKNLPYA